MSEKSVVMQTKEPLTTPLLAAQLQSAGVLPGDTLLVHSSMSAIGWVCGGEPAVIAGLLKAVGPRGTIIMPAQSGGNSDPAIWENPPVPRSWWDTIRENMPAYDPAVTPTRGVGRVAEVFRTWPGAVRSDHPQVSFCAVGARAAELMESHPLDGQFGMDSPLGGMYRRGARVLMLGTTYGTCTALHLAEAVSGSQRKTTYSCAINRDGVRQWVSYEDFDFDTSDFMRLGQDFEQEIHAFAQGFVGNANCRIVSLAQLVDYGVGWMRRNRK